MKQSKNVTKSNIRMTRVTKTKNQRMHQKITPPNSYHLEGGLMSGKVNELSREMKETIKYKSSSRSRIQKEGN